MTEGRVKAERGGGRLIFADKFQFFKRARPGKARRLLIVPFKNKLVK
jgi:hypothetical protein